MAAELPVRARVLSVNARRLRQAVGRHLVEAAVLRQQVVQLADELLDFGDVVNNDRFRIFAYAAEARSFALGTIDPTNEATEIRGFGSFALQTMPRPYDRKHYSHSRQLRSSIVDEGAYWARVMADCGF